MKWTLPMYCILVASVLLNSVAVRARSPQAAKATTTSFTVFLPAVHHVGATTPPPTGSPVIERFDASEPSGPLAAKVELRWQVRNATQVAITPDVGVITTATSIVVHPLATTTYTLTATNARGSVTSTTTYTVTSLPTPDPITVTAQLDVGRAVAAEAGPDGGAIEATGADGTSYRLEIPPDALLYTEAITLTPVKTISQLPMEVNSIHAVSIAPEGIFFVEPGTLIITPPAPAGTDMLSVGFAYEEAGSNFHLRRLVSPMDSTVVAQAGQATQMPVTTARSYGHAHVKAADTNLGQLIPRTPSNPVDAVEHIGTASDKLKALAWVGLAYLDALRPGLQAAGANPDGPAPLDIDSVAKLYLQWRPLVREYGLDREVEELIAEGSQLLDVALRRGGDLAQERCNQGRPAQGFALQRFARYAKKAGLSRARTQLNQQLRACWTFKLEFDSTMSKAIEDVSARTRVASTTTLKLSDDGKRIVGTDALVWQEVDYPLSTSQVRAECVQQSVETADGTFDAQHGERGLILKPVSRTNPNVLVALAYDPGVPDGTITWKCRGGVIVQDPLNWWRVFYEMFHIDEATPTLDYVTAQVAPRARSWTWTYQDTLNGGGAVATENTTITIDHTPEQ